MLFIDVIDRGHGMTRDTVINKWLVPSTTDKYDRKVSPAGRIMQGRKGIGRYAASILGDSLALKTVTNTGETTELVIEWGDFVDSEFLDDVEILVNTTQTNTPQGTILTISAGKNYVTEWNSAQLRKLQFELRKLIHPVDTEIFRRNGEIDNFEIFLNFYNFPGHEGREQIKPFPLFSIYDYRISGSMDAKGKGEFIFQNQRARNTVDEKISFDLGYPTECGSLSFDIRVYDRETDAIDQLILRGLKDDVRGDYLGRREAINLLNQYNGIGVYRNGFRIRPMGDPGFDWLELDKKRIQEPTLRIGSNQVIGFVLVESEEISGLIEKSARDGFKENVAYSHLRDITSKIVISRLLQSRRYEYRMNAGLGRSNVKIERELTKLFEYDELKQGILAKLKKAGVSDEVTSEVIKAITQKEDENNQLAENIRQTVAIYQGQATLGKIVRVVLHEGRRPLNFFKQQVPNLNFQAEKLRKQYLAETLAKILSLTGEFGSNGDELVDLFKRLDPLAAGKRGKKQELNIEKVIQGTFLVFEKELQDSNIHVNITCPADVTFLAWQQDIYEIMTNLIDNSIFWMNSRPLPIKEINVFINFDQGLQYIDYRDTGPGIEEHLIKSGVIFEPDFSTKPEGTGLGLAIAGEAATRNGLELKAFASNTGAYFRLQPREE